MKEFGLRSRWKHQRHPTNPIKTKNQLSRTVYRRSNFEHGGLPRDNDGAIELWRLKDYIFGTIWSDNMWKSKMEGGRGNKKHFQYCADSSGTILYLRVLQGHSGRNHIHPSLQDKVLIPNGFFKYIYHFGCAINLHLITNSGLILGGQNVSRRQTVFFTSVDPMNKEHRDLEKIDLEAPRLAWYHQKKWKKHQNTVYWVDIKLAQRNGLEFYQTREWIGVLSNKIECNHPPRRTPSSLYPECCCDGIWRNHTRESICVTSTSSKDFL